MQSRACGRGRGWRDRIARPDPRLALGLVLLLVLAALPAARPGQPAPELTGGPWINSSPLSLAGLRGRVVFVEFWTYG